MYNVRGKQCGDHKKYKNFKIKLVEDMQRPKALLKY